MKIFEFAIKNRNPQDPYLIPAVIYGHQIKESISCAINKRDFVKLVKTNTRNIIVNCQLENGQSYPTLIQEVQKNILSLEPTHVDFFAIDLQKPITITIPIHLQGQSVGVKNSGILVHHIHELTLTGKPENLPAFINLDIQSLEIGQHLSLRDLSFSSDVTSSVNMELPIVSIQEPHIEIAPEKVETVSEAAKEVSATPTAPAKAK
ncbi:50S ribosomal protein L25 [bacterium]|nr:50S ribosomal protein L25 [bacterium]